ncbi:site-specific integrase [Aestuariispira ectoiniformans]|uniref:site-specific integrase n=1 Tax=Aestuariispira ectoiniformans TaxID=2775080 RepID=UPI00223B7719|nr:site-specific integrase [Aestuariispira ectoiniformans]
MTAAKYCIRRGSTFYFRCRIPCDLIAVFGRREILRSLRTIDPIQANDLAKTISAQADKTFTTIRHQLLLGVDTEIIRTTARSFEDKHLPCHRAKRSLSRHVAHSLLLEGHNSEGGTLLSDASKTYVQDRQSGWEPKTKMMQEAALRLFLEIVGDKPVAQVTREEGRRFRDTVAKLPPNMSKRFRGMSIKQVLALAPDPMSVKNTNKILSVSSAFFNWAVEEKLLHENPIRGLKLKANHRADQEREAFSEEDLKRLFAQSPLYSGCLSERHRDQKGAMVIKDAKYWLPLIGLYSGMRLEEIAQLRVADLRQEQGVWVFDVNAEGSNKLKTQQSERLVPVHSKLIEKGLIDCRNAVKGERLWPDLKQGNDGFYSSPFSKWFGRYKKKIGITNPKVTFHSLRHTFINALKQRGVEESKIKELVGHKETSITMGRYGKRYEPDCLAETIEPIGFEGIRRRLD